MAKIAACLIVRDSASTIERTIETIRPFVDEINVFDTGSSDGTPTLLRQMNRRKSVVMTDAEGKKHKVPLAPISVEVAKKRELPLSSDGLLGDFSWAREQSFKMASDDCDWLFWLDDDDVIVGAENLKMLAATAHQSIDAFVMFYDYAQDGDGRNVCALWRERLLRRKDPSEWGWRNAVHEVWLPHEGTGIAPNYIMVPAHQVRFVHQRPPDRYPSTRNLSILEGMVAEARAAGGEPDPRTKAYMGTEMMSHGRFADAIPWLNSYLEDPRSAPGDERSQVYHKLGIALRSLGQPEAAVQVEFQALKERDNWAENEVGLCEAFAELGEFQRAEIHARRALELGQPQSMLILNPLEFSLVPLARLAQALAGQRRFEEAAPVIQQAIAVQPGNPMVLQTAAQIERDGMRERATQAVMTLREILIRWDENWKAHELLQRAVPHIIEEDPRVVAARAMQTENVMHALKPEEYTRWYEDDPKESTVPDEWVENAGDYIERAKFTLEVCEKFEAEHGRKPRVLDLGCNDAWMLGYLWKAGGFEGDGIELNKASVEKAAGRVERFGIPGRIVQGNIFDAQDLLRRRLDRGTTEFNDALSVNGVSDNGADVWFEPQYDIVTCFEVYEHVPDTDTLLDVMESLLTPEGVACVTTPNGAFEDGNIAMWQIVERKGHLRAVTYMELAEQLNARGKIVDMKIHNGGRLTFAAWQPMVKKGKIVIYAPGAFEPWSPLSVRDGGIGGSETCLTYLAIGLSQEGYDVRVFADATPGLYVGSLWRPSGSFNPTVEADAIIVSRAPAAFDVELHAPIRALWCHDATYGDQLTEKRAARITHLIALSDWSAESFVEQYPFLEGKTTVIRNGVSLATTDGDPKFPDGDRGFADRKPVCIYSSSADRGLDKLLEVWPTIRAQVPFAELHVYYGFDTLDRAARMRPELVQFKQHIFQLAAAAGGEEGGVFFKGRVGQDDLYAAMQEARVWTYPTYFTETSCITAMEARAAGLAIVTSDLAALKETVGEHGMLLGPEIDDAYLATFAGLVSSLLLDEEAWTRWHERARADVDECAWPRRVEEWVELVHPGTRTPEPLELAVA